tara:strand:+ start:93 stop:932 length:840 start_codon:yes stop_codon:yes gene_type:complete
MINQLTDQLIFPDWPVKNIQAFSTTREPPVFIAKPFSTCNSHLLPRKNALQHFNYFNLGLHVGDDEIIVRTNRQNLAKSLPNECKIQWLEQVHGSKVVNVVKQSDKAKVADAAITDNKSVALAVMTADCLPILLSDKDGKEVAAIHGGWRSLVSGIIANTVKKMQTPSCELYAWLGPCIGPSVFEVGKEVKDAFLVIDECFSSAFKIVQCQSQNSTESLDRDKEKYLADLHQIATMQLANLGVRSIFGQNDCTYSQPNRYYSFRRDGQTGRMATVICRK